MATAIIPAKYRKPAYSAYGLVGVGLGATQVVLAVYNMTDLKLFVAALAVYSFLGGAFGFVAADNTHTKPESLEPLAPPQALETDVREEDAMPADMEIWEDPIVSPDAADAAAAEIDETPVPEGYEPRH